MEEKTYRLRTTAKFICPEDYFNYTGQDLRAILNPNNNISNQADIFLMNVEEYLMARIDKISFRLYDWDNLSEFQIHCLQIAIIKQAEYILRNSDIFTDSGYDPEKGVVISRQQLETIQICSASIDELVRCGLLNHVIRNRQRFVRLH